MKWRDWKNLSDADRRDHESLFGFERRITKELGRELNSNIFAFIMAMIGAIIVVVFSAILMFIVGKFGENVDDTKNVLDAIGTLSTTVSIFLYVFMAIMTITWLVFMANLILAYKKEKDWFREKQSRIFAQFSDGFQFKDDMISHSDKGIGEEIKLNKEE